MAQRLWERGRDLSLTGSAHGRHVCFASETVRSVCSATPNRIVFSFVESLEANMDFFAKTLTAMTIEDIRWLVEKKVRETSDLEFKALPQDYGGKENAWIKQDGTVTRDCKEALVKELVAFANARGGNTRIRGFR